MQHINIVNLKCGGCANTITKSLTKKGFKNVSVDVKSSRVDFDGDVELARTTLSKLGYPEQGSPEADSLLKKAKSYASCAVGRL